MLCSWRRSYVLCKERKGLEMEKDSSDCKCLSGDPIFQGLWPISSNRIRSPRGPDINCTASSKSVIVTVKGKARSTFSCQPRSAKFINLSNFWLISVECRTPYFSKHIPNVPEHKDASASVIVEAFSLFMRLLHPRPN